MSAPRYRGVRLNVNARTDPVSCDAASLTVRNYVPLGFWPRNAVSGLAGLNVPLNGAPPAATF